MDAADRDADITALTALLVLPWALKFLWAPMVDALATRPRSLSFVIAIAQLGMLLTLLPLFTLDLAASFSTDAASPDAARSA